MGQFDWVDIDRVKADFSEFLGQFGCPIYHRYFGSASTDPHFGNINYGTSTVESFVGAWRYVTAEDYRLITAGRVALGDAVAIIPSGVVTLSKTDEFYLKGSTDYFNMTWKQDSIVGSQIAFYELGLRMARGRR